MKAALRALLCVYIVKMMKSKYMISPFVTKGASKAHEIVTAVVH